MMKMNETLKIRLVGLGYNPERVYWGRVIAKGIGWITLETPDGKQVTDCSPFVTVGENIHNKVGTQTAIVRFN